MSVIARIPHRKWMIGSALLLLSSLHFLWGILPTYTILNSLLRISSKQIYKYSVLKSQNKQNKIPCVFATTDLFVKIRAVQQMISSYGSAQRPLSLHLHLSPHSSSLSHLCSALHTGGSGSPPAHTRSLHLQPSPHSSSTSHLCVGPIQ